MSYILLGNNCNYSTKSIVSNKKFIIPDIVIGKIKEKFYDDEENEYIDEENEEHKNIKKSLDKKKPNLTIRRIVENR